MGKYYSRIIRYAVKLWLLRLKDGKKQLLGFIFKTSVIFAVLYFFPPLGNITDKAGEIGTLIIAVLATLTVQFVWDLVQAPVLIDRFQREDLGHALSLMRKALDADKHLRKLGEMHDEGKHLPELHKDLETLQIAYSEWKERCDRYLDEHYEYPILHEFRNSKDRFTSSFDGRIALKSAREELLSALEGKIHALDRIISMSGGRILPNFFHNALECEKHPIYEFLAPIYPD